MVQPLGKTHSILPGHGERKIERQHSDFLIQLVWQTSVRQQRNSGIREGLLHIRRIHLTLIWL